jgi:eukaryotic-like serine/threonine-protein kinase
MSYLAASPFHNSDTDVDALRNLPGLDGVLRLEGAGVSDAGLARLLGFAVFEKLTELEVVDTPAADATVAAAAVLPTLTRLVLTGTQITEAGLASLKTAKKLETLDLRRNKLTEARVKALAATIPACRIEWDGGVIEATKK